MRVDIVDGDLLDQEVDVIVNAWNRNILPWWLLIPQGVSGAIKKRGGITPFRELTRAGRLPLGSAVLTSAGRLPHRAIIHVAGINMLWRSSESSIRDSVASAIELAREHRFDSIAFPIIGSGSGGFDRDSSLSVMRSELGSLEFEGRVVIVLYPRDQGSRARSNPTGRRQ
jgi:O-acetyl-ADP-ribose deacetylase (regulator of RNase III)